MIDNYHEQKKEVLRIYDGYLCFETVYKQDELESKLATKAENIRNDKFNLLVAGEAKSGKSTFINAYLGAEILPMDYLQCTSALIEITYGKEPTLTAAYADGSKDRKTNEQEIRDFLQTHAAIQGEYRDIPVAAINNQILVKYRGEPNEIQVETLISTEKQEGQNLEEYKKLVWKYINEKKGSWGKIVTKIAITYPLSEEGIRDVTIIDSPGVNALGLVGNVTEEFIKKADALIFTKPLSGSAVDSKSFFQFFSISSKDSSKGALFLVLTHKADVATEEGVEKLYNEAVKKYGSKISKDHIAAVDSKMELCRYLCDKKTEAEILPFLKMKGYKNEKGLLTDEANRDKGIFLSMLEENSGFIELKKMLDQFGRKAKNQQLYDFLDIIGKGYDILSSKLKEDSAALKKADSPEDLRLLMDKKTDEIDEIKEKMNIGLQEIRDEYIKGDTARIKQCVNDEFDKFIRSIEETKSFDDLKKKALEMQERFNAFRTDLQNQIITDCNEKLVKLAEDKTVPFESLAPLFTADNLRTIESETKKNARVEGDFKWYEKFWFWIKSWFGEETDTTVYSFVEHLKKYRDSLKNEIEKQKDPMRGILEKDCKDLTIVYSKELQQNAAKREQEYRDLRERMTTAEKMRKELETISGQLEAIKNNCTHLRGIMGGL